MPPTKLMWPHVPAPGQKPLNRTQYHRGRNLSQNHKRKKPHETRKGNSLTSRRQQAWASDESSESSGAHRRISAWERADLSGDSGAKAFPSFPAITARFPPSFPAHLLYGGLHALFTSLLELPNKLLEERLKPSPWQMVNTHSLGELACRAGAE